MDVKSPQVSGPIFAAIGMVICGIGHAINVALDWRVWAFFVIAALFSLQALIRWKRGRA